MTANEVLAELRFHGALIQIQGDRLRVEVQRGVVTPDLRRSLVRHKSEIIARINRRNVDVINCPWNGCDERVLLIDGNGYCQKHRMSVTVMDRGPLRVVF